MYATKNKKQKIKNKKYEYIKNYKYILYNGYY